MLKNKKGQWVEPPIDYFFGLSRCSYFVMPRLALQEMPLEWQEKFIALMNEAEEMGLDTPNYSVLRDDPEYTFKTKEDNDDNELYDPNVTGYIPLKSDPWANYRRGSVKELCETFKNET